MSDIPCKQNEHPGELIDAGAKDRLTVLAQYALPPACIYLMSATIASPGNNPRPVAHAVKDVQLLPAFHACFGGHDDESNFFNFEVAHRKTYMIRKTAIIRGEQVLKGSKLTAIRRK